MRRTPKRTQRSTKLRVEPSRLAVAALERIKTIHVRKGHAERFGGPTSDEEIADRARLMRRPLPPSYESALRVCRSIGEEEQLLDAEAMARERAHTGHAKLFPFCRLGDVLLCFDLRSAEATGELPVVEEAGGAVRPRARSFAEWLDQVADRREEAMESAAATLPVSLRALLVQLGFTFDDPVVGRLETGDPVAIEELIGPDLAAEVRGQHNRLFDSSGKASLVLNLDEFTLACSLRSGILVFEAEDVFRWLRTFRDENFFGDIPRAPLHADRVRDLRKAPREPPLVLRGVVSVATLPASRHAFRAATGASAQDFYVLGRTSSTKERSPSLLLHVKNGAITTAHAVDEPLHDLYAAPDDSIWGLSATGSAIHFVDGRAKVHPLRRPTRGRPWWYGIGGVGDRVIAWGAGAMLVFDGKNFVPFTPDAGLESTESVISLCPGPRGEIAMLVCGEHIGAVARFDGKKWLPIAESHVLEGSLLDLDVWRGVGVVLGKDGTVYRVDDAAPRPVRWDKSQAAFRTQAGAPRALHAVRGVDGGAVLAGDGGVVIAGSGDPVFYEATGTQEPARLARLGPLGIPAGSTESWQSGIAIMCGPHVWMWQNGAMTVLDMRGL